MDSTRIGRSLGQRSHAGAGSDLVNALTIDVEDWYQLANRKLLGQSVPPCEHVRVTTHRMLDLLARYGTHATFFVLGTVAEEFPELVVRIHDEGHEVATHGYGHGRVFELGQEVFEADLMRSIRVLQDITGEPILGHRAAEFSINGSSRWAMEIIAAAGLVYDSSVFPVTSSRYGIPHAPRHPYTIDTSAGVLREFPLATLNLFGLNVPIAGGGYLRVLPMEVIRQGIRQLNSQGQMAVMYVHTYDLDETKLDLTVPHQSPRQKCRLLLRCLRRNLGRGLSIENRLEGLIQTFPFAPLREAIHFAEHERHPGALRKTRSAIRSVVCREVTSSHVGQSLDSTSVLPPIRADDDRVR